eukprot:g18624.t1
MPQLTEELIRKRAEHNEGVLSDLEEIALHQQDWRQACCRHIKILLLQNNIIPKMEGLNKLKELEYLNLALNNISKIEGIEGCESLRKLDLTVNFVSVEELEESVYNLKANMMLEDLAYVIAHLPQLKQLDAKLVLPRERIKARQQLPRLQQDLEVAIEEARRKRLAAAGEPVSEGAYTKDRRNEMYLELAEQKAEKERNEKRRMGMEPKELRTVPGVYNARGEIRQCNEGKYNFDLDDWTYPDKIVFELGVPKYLDTTALDVDVNPLYVRVVVKDKVTQLKLSAEVKPDASKVQRSRTTGLLHIDMPLVEPHQVKERKAPEPELQPLKPSMERPMGSAGDMVNALSGKEWIPKWEAKVVMATVTKAQTLNTNKALILCIAGGKNCDAEMGRQPALVRAIKTEMGKEDFRVRVEWIEIDEFLERYPSDALKASKSKSKDGKGGKAGDGKGGNSNGAANAKDAKNSQANSKASDTQPGSAKKWTDEGSKESKITQTSAAQLADLFEHHSQLPSASQLVILSQDTLLREVKTTRATPKATEEEEEDEIPPLEFAFVHKTRLGLLNMKCLQCLLWSYVLFTQGPSELKTFARLNIFTAAPLPDEPFARPVDGAVWARPSTTAGHMDQKQLTPEEVRRKWDELLLVINNVATTAGGESLEPSPSSSTGRRRGRGQLKAAQELMSKSQSTGELLLAPKRKGRPPWNDRHHLLYSTVNDKMQKNVRAYFDRPREIDANGQRYDEPLRTIWQLDTPVAAPPPGAAAGHPNISLPSLCSLDHGCKAKAAMSEDGGSFWATFGGGGSDGAPQVSALEKLLQTPNCSVEALLDEEEVIQEFKTGNKSLVARLSEPDGIKVP